MKHSIRYFPHLLGAGIFCLAAHFAPAYAGMVETDQAAAQEQAQQERERIKAFADRKDVARQLQAMGVAPDQVGARVDAMSHEEVHALAGRIATAPAGGDVSTFQAIVLALLAAIVVLLI